MTLSTVRFLCPFVLLGKLVFLRNVLFKSSHIPCHPTGHGKCTYLLQAEKYSLGGLPAILLHLTVLLVQGHNLDLPALGLVVDCTKLCVHMSSTEIRNIL